MLQGDDGLHRGSQRMATYLDGLDEPLRRIHLLLDIEQCLLGLTTQVLLVVLVLLHRIDKRLRDLQFRHLAVVEGEGHRPVVLRVDDEVWGDLLDAAPHRLAHRGTRTGIQFPQFLEQRLRLDIRQREGGLYLIPMLLGKSLEIVGNHLLHQRFYFRVVATADLYQQTFLQRTGTDARRIEVLQHFQHVLYLLVGGIDIMIDGQFVADHIRRLAQQTIVIQRADQILHDVALAVGEFRLTHLFHQLVIERLTLTIDHLLAILGHVTATVIDWQVLIVAPDTGEGLIQGRLPFLALSTDRVVIRGILVVLIVSIFRGVGQVIARISLQSRIVVHLRIDTVHQLGDGQFHERGLQQLLVRDRLCQFLPLRLSLFLYLTLRHYLKYSFNWSAYEASSSVLALPKRRHISVHGNSNGLNVTSFLFR